MGGLKLARELKDNTCFGSIPETVCSGNEPQYSNPTHSFKKKTGMQVGMLWGWTGFLQKIYCLVASPVYLPCLSG